MHDHEDRSDHHDTDLADAPGSGREAPARGLRVPGRRISNGESPDRIRELARRGTSGAGDPLPHLDVIQRLFGRHDVTGVTAHSDPAAAGAAEALGAGAFATGDHVVFGTAPTLHTTAHEAAHVIQQRRGVQLAGPMDHAGDAHEGHADLIADRVVRGEPVEAPTAGTTRVPR